MRTTVSRMAYVDNLRILLSCLVILFHWGMTYGVPGGWAYADEPVEFPWLYFMTLHNATCQSFFMGMFFLITAYFTHLSLERKGRERFLKDRFMRLGVPLLVYGRLVTPLTSWIAWGRAEGLSYLDVALSLRAGGFGVMWFVEAVIYFTAIYVVVRAFTERLRDNVAHRPFVLKDWHVFAYAGAVGIAAFCMRLVWPVGRGIGVLGFNMAHFAQYIPIFAIGILAANNKLEDAIGLAQAKRFFLVALGFVVLLFPAMFVAGGALSGDVEPFLGGWHWQSFAYCLWEQITGHAIMVFLLGWARKCLNGQNAVTRELSGAAYATYIFHPPVIVAVAVIATPWAIPPLLKYAGLAPVAVALSFAAGVLIRRLPFARRFV
ncbi:MAG: acyltransferase family protein [Candidatus Hydrogenedentes bacterium]|nr:acyltransferase family protein [Candidatus Hydrogenedentota bacterium]